MRRSQVVPLGLLASIALLVSGCAVVSPRTSEKQPQATIKDVPFQARASREAVPRKRVMVLPFIDSAGNRSATATQVARDAFIRTLKKTDDFVVVSNTDFPKDIATYLKNGEYDLEAMGKIGGGMGLAAIIEGRVLDIKAKRLGDEVGLMRQVRARIEATAQIRMVNTKNGSVVLNETRTAQAEDTTTRWAERSYSDRFLEDDPKLIEAVISEAFRSTVPRISQSIDKLSWEGRVALVKGDRVYLNAGRMSGLQIGDILKITDDGEDVYDPESGGLIGKVPGRLKGTVEIISYFGKDGSIAIVHSGSGFRENDKVELY